jgi:succinate dehydrogenase / fumarate reductase cytochrome b subunit
MADATPGLRPRPVSPNIQLDGGIWRWHITMTASILHRASGSALYVGALVVMAWALSLAAGPDAYNAFANLAGSIVGRIVLIGLTLAVFYHLANGIRHLAWDSGYGFQPQTANATAWLVILVAIGATAAFWAAVIFAGAA